MNKRFSNLKKQFDSLTVIVDFFSIVGSLLVARFIRARTDLIPGVQLPIGEIPEFSSFLIFSIGAAVLFIFIGLWQKLYFKNHKVPYWEEFGNIAMSLLVWVALLSTYFYFTRELFFSRLALLYATVIVFFISVIFRLVLSSYERYLETKGSYKKRMWIIGNNEEINQFKLIFGKTHIIISEFTNTDGISDEFGFFERLFNKEIPDVLAIGDSVRDKREHFLVRCCQIFGLEYVFLPNSYTNYLPGGIYMDFFENQPYIIAYPSKISGFWAFLKRILDILFSFVSIIIFSPVFVFVSIISFLNQGFPILYSCERVGLHGNVFRMYKFRSMVNEAEKLKKELENKNERSGKLFKIKEDPRVTKWGKFLRKWSIDELPQLFNILKGDMSFVGPRPHEPKEVNKYILEERRLLSIRPGLTSFYTTHGRKVDFNKEVELDIYYLENWNLLLDAYVIISTFFLVLKGTGE